MSRFVKKTISAKGFTIAELMISMTIFSLISMMLVMMFNQSARFEKKMKAELSLKQRVRIVHESLEPYMNSAVPPNSNIPIVFTPFDSNNTFSSVLQVENDAIATFTGLMNKEHKKDMDNGEADTLYLWITRTYALKNFYRTPTPPVFDPRVPRYTGMRVTFNSVERDDDLPQGSVSVSALNLDLDNVDRNGLDLDVTEDNSWDNSITLFGGRSIGLEDVQFHYEGGDRIRTIVTVVEDARGMVGTTESLDDDDDDDGGGDDDGGDDDEVRMTVKRLTLPRIYRLPFQDRPMN